MKLSSTFDFVEKKVQGLGEHDTIEGLGRQILAVRQVTHEGCQRVAVITVQNIACGNPTASETHRIGVVANLQDPSGYVQRTGREESLDIAAVHWLAAIKTELRAEGYGTLEVTEPGARAVPT